MYIADLMHVSRRLQSRMYACRNSCARFRCLSPQLGPVWGHGEREATEDDWAASPRTRLTYHMQRVVFAGVMADAEMVERALDHDMRHGTCIRTLRSGVGFMHGACARGARRAGAAAG